MKIPFCKATFNEKEEEAVVQCMRSGWVVLGPKTQEFEEAFADYVGGKYAVFVDSGTAALFLAIKAANLQGAIRIPSLTFVSDAEVIHNSGNKIEFVDVDRDTLCVDEQYDNLLPVNFSGVLAKGKGKVIDSCHRIERDDVKDSDSLWTYSFYYTKNISTVQGGMIVLNDKEKYEWLLKSRDHGITKGTKERYEGNKPNYDMLFRGWRFKGDDFRAVIGLEQLKKLPWITSQRNRVVARYNKNLGLDRKGNHILPIFVQERAKFIDTLYEQGIQTSIHFPLINKFTAYKDESAYLPVSEWVEPRICSLPLYPQMTDEDVDMVSEAVLKTGLLVK